jgi:copper chaperone CopZ
MQKTMRIDGMMCPHCEARVKKTLEKLEEVNVAEVSHEKGTAIIELNSEVSIEEGNRRISLLFCPFLKAPFCLKKIGNESMFENIEK